MFCPGGNVSDPYRSVCYDEAEALREVALASFVWNATVTSLARSCCWRRLRNEYCGGSIPGIMDKVSYLEVDGQHSAQKMVR